MRDLCHTDDDLIPLKQARKLFRGVQKMDTVRRWCKIGTYHRVSGTFIKLPSIRIGGRIFTSHSAIEDFIRVLNDK